MYKARFAVGDAVRVLDLDKNGHIRTPSYIRRKTGRVVQVCGCYLNPEDLAVGRTSGPAVPLYRVAFGQSNLWPDYKGPETDRLIIEIYDHWLSSSVEPSTVGDDR